VEEVVVSGACKDSGAHRDSAYPLQEIHRRLMVEDWKNQGVRRRE
jgi:hypothetical protein